MIGALSTKQQFLLSKFLNALNEEWDIAGIEHALGQAREMAPGPELACAAIRAAVTVGNRTPAVIALQGPHWRAVSSSTTVRMPKAGPGERCSVCSHPQAMCRALYDDSDHRFVSVAEQARRALEEEKANEVAAAVRKNIHARRGTQHVVDDDEEREEA
jgi:hypothetical protein